MFTHFKHLHTNSCKILKVTQIFNKLLYIKNIDYVSANMQHYKDRLDSIVMADCVSLVVTNVAMYVAICTVDHKTQSCNFTTLIK